jgi:hypothetical protein
MEKTIIDIAKDLVAAKGTPIIKRKEIIAYCDQAGGLLKDIYKTLLAKKNALGNGVYDLSSVVGEKSNTNVTFAPVSKQVKQSAHDAWVERNIAHQVARRAAMAQKAKEANG